jgi:regulator of RNase E activity RraA
MGRIVTVKTDPMIGELLLKVSMLLKKDDVLLIESANSFSAVWGELTSSSLKKKALSVL